MKMSAKRRKTLPKTKVSIYIDKEIYDWLVKKVEEHAASSVSSLINQLLYISKKILEEEERKKIESFRIKLKG